VKKSVSIFVALLGLMVFPSYAQDAGLYDPAPPAGSAFVRFINLGAKNEACKPDIRGKSYDSIDQNKVGPYVPAKSGDAELKLDAASAKETLEEGGYYTVVYRGDALSVIKDDAIKNPVKSMVAFYNLTPRNDISLKTADGKVDVIKSLASGKSGYREINAVTVKLVVYDGARKAVTLKPIILKRREPTAIIVRETANGKLAVRVVAAKTDTTQ